MINTIIVSATSSAVLELVVGITYEFIFVREFKCITLTNSDTHSENLRNA